MVTKSFTKRKSETSKKEVNVDRVLVKAKAWMQDENATFVCAKISDRHYKIGPYDVKHKDSKWAVSRINQSSSVMFNERVSAVAYCALMHDRRTLNAREVLTLDNKVYQLGIDELLFKTRLSGAINSKDDWKVDLYNARYTNTKVHLATAKIELQKTLNFAKYIKLWTD